VLLWALAGWTAAGSFAELFFQGAFSRAVAGGLRDPAGQRLLGVQGLLLAAVYAAASRTRGGWLSWLPLAGQSGLAIVLLIDTLDGERNLGAAAPALSTALVFALLLGAFRLAGDTTIHPEHSSRHAAGDNGTFPASEGSPTERLTSVDAPTLRFHGSSDRPADPPRHDGDDDRLLGI
jgi:hypothetical protein